MTSTLGVWILTGYGAAKAPRLMQLSVHCDHLRSVLFVRAGPSPYGEMVAALTTLFRKKMCASIYVHGRGRNFYGLPAFFTIWRKGSGFVKALPPKNSPIYGHGKGQELGAFQKRFWKLIFCLTEKHGPFWPVFYKLFLHSPLYGEKHAVLIRCFPKTFSASSTIRRNACPFVNVFPRKDLLPWYTATGKRKT